MKRVVVLAVVVTLAGCGGGSHSSSDVEYSSADSSAVWPLPDNDATSVLTFGVAIANRSDEDVTITDFDVAGATGIETEPKLTVGMPRDIGSVAAAVGFPPAPEGRWPESSVSDLDLPLTIAAHSEPGPLVLVRVERDGDEGSIDGFVVKGKQGGRTFIDRVDSAITVCWDGCVGST